MSEYQLSCAPMDSHVDLPLIKENKNILKSIDNFIECPYIFHLMADVNVIYKKTNFTILLFNFTIQAFWKNLPVVTLLQNDWKCNAVSGELKSKLTMSEKPNICKSLCDANIKIY